MKTETKGYNLTIELNDFNLSYDDMGEGSVPIIFLHGFPFDKSMWKGQLDFLKDTHRSITYDIRGFGKSTDEKSSLSMELFTADLIEFMDKLHLEKAIICGLSMGGYIALHAMKKFPERFEALILSDTQCIADSAEVKENRYKTIDGIEKEGVTTFNTKFIESVFHKDSLTHKKELVEQLRKVVFSNSEHIIKQGLIAIAERSETCSTLHEINVPTLILCGREDKVTPLNESEFMDEAIKESILHVIENAVHVSNLEQPDEFNKRLVNFLTVINNNNGEWIDKKRKMLQ